MKPQPRGSTSSRSRLNRMYTLWPRDGQTTRNFNRTSIIQSGSKIIFHMAGAEGKLKKSNNKPRIPYYDFNSEPFEMPLSAAQINSFSVVQTNSANHFSVAAAGGYEVIGCLTKCRATVPKLLVFPHCLNPLRIDRRYFSSHSRTHRTQPFGRFFTSQPYALSEKL